MLPQKTVTRHRSYARRPYPNAATAQKARLRATKVVGLDCQVHNYPGLFVVDGSIMPANPGINSSLTIAALAEYAMSQVPPKGEEGQ